MKSQFVGSIFFSILGSNLPFLKSVAVAAAGFVPDGATIPEVKAEDATAEPKGKEPEHIYEIYVPRENRWVS